MATVFKKIIERKLPADIVFENDSVIAFRDINPLAPIHILICPKKEIPDIQSMHPEDYPLLSEVVAVAQKIAAQEGIADSYRLLTNCGTDSGQTIFHLHFHLIGGAKLGPMA